MQWLAEVCVKRPVFATMLVMISQNRNDGIWGRSLTPVDPVEVGVPHTSLPEALDAALQNRPELEINQTQKDINAIDQKFFKEQTKPQIDFVTTYTLTGAAGTINPSVTNPFSTTDTLNGVINRLNTVSAGTNPELPPLPTVVPPPVNVNNDLIGGNPQAFQNLVQNKYPTFRVGVQFNLPLFGDKTAHGVTCPNFKEYAGNLLKFVDKNPKL